MTLKNADLSNLTPESLPPSLKCNSQNYVKLEDQVLESCMLYYDQIRVNLLFGHFQIFQTIFLEYCYSKLPLQCQKWQITRFLTCSF
jgi:hypothetical protein